VAIVSGDLDYYWAYLDGARVTMQIDFGASPCPNCGSRHEQWERARLLLAPNGVAFVIAPCVAGVVDQPGWRQLGDTNVFAYRVR